MLYFRAFAMCAASWMVVGCSDGGNVGPQDSGPPDDVHAASDSGIVDAAHPDADAAQVVDAHAPAAPKCNTGDRSEWAGTIPGTFVAVAVCSMCGESYVIAANGDTTSVDVTVDNGSKTITTTVAPNATATSAKIADKSDGTVTVCTTGSHCLPTSPKNERYCDPFRSITSLVAERIDQGVDYAGSGPIYAIGPGTIDVYRNRNDTGWPGGTFISYKVTAGPASGKVIYLAENIDLDTSLKSGSAVWNGTVLGTLVNAYPNSETGWGVLGAGYTAEYSCYTEGCTTALGMNFNDLLVALKTPSGIKETTGCCTSTMGYPASWSTLVAGWQ